MRLSEWRAKAPSKDAGGPKVAAVVDAVLDALGAEGDPHCWVAWGDEPAVRYTIFVPTAAGLISSFVRVNVPGEGPRATTKLVRWGRVAIGELAIETQGGHRLLSFQIEQQVLRGTDAEADRAAAFAMRVIAGIDGRALPPEVERTGRRSSASKVSLGKAKSSGATTGTRSTSTTPARLSPASPRPTRGSGR